MPRNLVLILGRNSIRAKTADVKISLKQTKHKFIEINLTLNYKQLYGSLKWLHVFHKNWKYVKIFTERSPLAGKNIFRKGTES